MNIANRITYFRTAKNYSVNKLANLCGISQSYLRDIELGKKNPTVEILSLICNTLDVSLQDFFAENEADTLANSPLMQRIYKLTPSQKNALMNFLDAMSDNLQSYPDVLSRIKYCKTKKWKPYIFKVSTYHSELLTGIGILDALTAQ